MVDTQQEAEKVIPDKVTQVQAPEVTVPMVTQTTAENVTSFVAQEVTVRNNEIHEEQHSLQNVVPSSRSFSVPL